MGCMTVRYYELVKDYLHLHLHKFIDHYRYGNYIDLPLYYGCNPLNKNGIRKEIEYNLGYQCIIPTHQRYWKKTKDKYRQRIGIWGIYMTRYMTRTNLRHLFKNKGNFIYNYKLKRFEHMSETPVWGSFYHMQSIKKEIFKHELK